METMSIVCLICGQEFEDELDFMLHIHQRELSPNVIVHEVYEKEIMEPEN